MFRYIRKIKGQSTLEYAILIVVIIGALLAIQVYLKRGLQGRIKQAADDIGSQFSPGNFNEVVTTYTYKKTNETFTAGTGGTVQIGAAWSNRDFAGGIINGEIEYWGEQRDE